MKGLIEKGYNYKATLSMYSRVRAGALTTIISEYRVHFEQIRDYLYEVYKQHLGTIAKVKTFKDANDQHVFRFLYIFSGTLKRGFLDGCRRVILVDPCFLKGPCYWYGCEQLDVLNNMGCGIEWEKRGV